MISNLVLRLLWHRVTDTYWYPEKWWDRTSRVTTWKAAIHIDGGIDTLISVSAAGLRVTLDHETGLAKWNKINQVDRLEYTAQGCLIWLPHLAEPEGTSFRCVLSDGHTELAVEAEAPLCPSENAYPEPIESSVDWEHGQACLVLSARERAQAAWYVQRNGQWVEQAITEVDAGGQARLGLQLPFAETVYLEIKTIGQDTTWRHRYYAVGRSGVVSGRHLWYRGTLYSPKITKPLPWISVIAPVFHPDDVERVPAFVKWNQIEWWVYPGMWTDEAIQLINEKFPQAGIVRLGKFGDERADVQILRPVEVQGATLSPEKRYAVHLFDDAGDVEFARRAGWLMDRLQAPDLQRTQFIERAWRQGVIPQKPVDGAPQYGFGFSFTRPPDHEFLWQAAQRDLDWREQKEDFPCNTCVYKHSCRQSLPIPYAASESRGLPWIALETPGCPLPRWFTKK